MKEQGRSKTGTASRLHVKLAPVSAPGPTGERQEHLDANIAFAGHVQRRRFFRVHDILTVKCAFKDIRKTASFFLDTQLMFLKKEEDTTTKLFDDEEWIRSPTEAQAVTTDTPKSASRTANTR